MVNALQNAPRAILALREILESPFFQSYVGGTSDPPTLSLETAETADTGLYGTLTINIEDGKSGTEEFTAEEFTECLFTSGGFLTGKGTFIKLSVPQGEGTVMTTTVTVKNTTEGTTETTIVFGLDDGTSITKTYIERTVENGTMSYCTIYTLNKNSAGDVVGTGNISIVGTGGSEGTNMTDFLKACRGFHTQKGAKINVKVPLGTAHTSISVETFGDGTSSLYTIRFEDGNREVIGTMQVIESVLEDGTPLGTPVVFSLLDGTFIVTDEKGSLMNADEYVDDGVKNVGTISKNGTGGTFMTLEGGILEANGILFNDETVPLSGVTFLQSKYGGTYDFNNKVFKNIKSQIDLVNSPKTRKDILTLISKLELEQQTTKWHEHQSVTYTRRGEELLGRILKINPETKRMTLEYGQGGSRHTRFMDRDEAAKALVPGIPLGSSLFW